MTPRHADKLNTSIDKTIFVICLKCREKITVQQIVCIATSLRATNGGSGGDDDDDDVGNELEQYFLKYLQTFHTKAHPRSKLTYF